MQSGEIYFGMGRVAPENWGGSYTYAQVMQNWRYSKGVL